MARQCSFEPQLDLYGAGTRFGIYCQWVATLLARLYVPEERDTMDTSNICLQLGVFVALCLVSLQNQLHEPEVLIVLPLAFGGFVAASQLRSRNIRATTSVSSAPTFSRFGILCKIQVFGALAAYSTWYWWKGLSTSGPSDCHHVVFIFARVAIFKLRWLFRILGLLSGIAFSIAEGIGVKVFFSDVCTMGIRLAMINFSTQQELPKFSSSRGVWISRLGLFSTVMLMVYMMIMVEVTIAWNDIHDAYSITTAGQTIPFVVGISGLIKVLFGLVMASNQKSSLRQRYQGGEV